MKIAERLSRWLLMCQDRTESDDLEITHQSLADMLGTPRSTVTLAARMLQKAGLIDYSRGHIQIRNRKGLEESACECYRTIRNECDRLQIFS
jgi:CRP-like cAMP-binding protein